ELLQRRHSCRRYDMHFNRRLATMRLFSLVLILAAAPSASAQMPWESVTSKEGGFTVEMPAKPSLTSTRTRKGPGGTVKILLIGCETKAGAYIVYKIDLPTAVVKGAEGMELAGWGLAIDPDADCQFKPDGKTLSMQVPGSWHDLHPDSGKLNSPRVLKEMEGDFAVIVKVTGDFQPGGKSTNPKGVPYNGA